MASLIRALSNTAMAISGEAAADDVKLLGIKLSPFVIRARIALNLKGVEYEFLEEATVNEKNEFVFLKSKSELLRESNPVYKKVPVLVHGGRPVCESMIIVEYVDDAWAATGPAILPSDPYDRATARFWAFYVDDKLFPAFRKIIKAKTAEAMAEAAKKYAAAFQPLEAALANCSGEGSLFGGDDIGYVDIALGGHLGWIRAAEELSGSKFLAEETTPNLTRWAERLFSEDAVKEVMPETEEFLEFGKVLHVVWNSIPSF